MDRNININHPAMRPFYVATREGGVDRNFGGTYRDAKDIRSPPARVAWIETFSVRISAAPSLVATREGGVDRNFIHNERGTHMKGRHPRGWRG